MVTSWIAEEPIVLVHADGRRESSRIAVGLPDRRSDSEASCVVACVGVLAHDTKIYGGTPLQALLLALRFLGYMIHNFMARGGRLLDDAGNDFVLEASFGPLICASTKTAAPP